MSIATRLNKLEESLGGSDRRCICPHAGLRVWYGSDDRAKCGESPREPLPNCEVCGGYQILLRVIYGSAPSDGETDGTKRDE